MSFFDAINVAASGLTANRVRMDVTAENLANAQTTRTANGGPYQRQEVVLQQVGGFDQTLAGAISASMPGATALSQSAIASSAASAGANPGGVQVAQIVADQTPDRLVYDPSNPDANAGGYVRMPNVQPVNEMVDLISESRAYEADVTAMQTAKTMYEKTLDLLK